MAKKKNGSKDLARYLLCAYRAWERGIGLESYVRRHWDATQPDARWQAVATRIIEAETAAQLAAEREFVERMKSKTSEENADE